MNTKDKNILQEALVSPLLNNLCKNININIFMLIERI